MQVMGRDIPGRKVFDSGVEVASYRGHLPRLLVDQGAEPQGIKWRINFLSRGRRHGKALTFAAALGKVKLMLVILANYFWGFRDGSHL
jgi:hypothetical protein